MRMDLWCHQLRFSLKTMLAGFDRSPSSDNRLVPRVKFNLVHRILTLSPPSNSIDLIHFVISFAVNRPSYWVLIWDIFQINYVWKQELSVHVQEDWPSRMHLECYLEKADLRFTCCRDKISQISNNMWISNSIWTGLKHTHQNILVINH